MTGRTEQDAVEAAARALWATRTSESWDKRLLEFPDSVDIGRARADARAILSASGLLDRLAAAEAENDALREQNALIAEAGRKMAREARDDEREKSAGLHAVVAAVEALCEELLAEGLGTVSHVFGARLDLVMASAALAAGPADPKDTLTTTELHRLG